MGCGERGRIGGPTIFEVIQGAEVTFVEGGGGGEGTLRGYIKKIKVNNQKYNKEVLEIENESNNVLREIPRSTCSST